MAKKKLSSKWLAYIILSVPFKILHKTAYFPFINKLLAMAYEFFLFFYVSLCKHAHHANARQDIRTKEINKRNEPPAFLSLPPKWEQVESLKKSVELKSKTFQIAKRSEKRNDKNCWLLWKCMRCVFMSSKEKRMKMAHMKPYFSINFVVKF